MEKTADGAHKLREVLSQGKEPHLMNGPQYIESLRDGRRIIDADGNEVKDVAEHPALKRSVKHLAELYDHQFDLETRDISTYVGEDGHRYSLAWKIPRTIEDLKERRKLLRLSTYHTLGVFGRPNDYGSMKSMGYLLIIDRIRKKNRELADNIEKFINFSKKHNLMSTDLVPNVQSDRTIPANERQGNLRIIEERPDGVVLKGAKPVGSNAVLSHFVTISTGLSPDLGPNEALWIAVPVNADGLKMVLRESTVDSDSSFDDHPIDSLGEEMDNMLLFDNVFVPNEYLFSIKDVELLSIYGETGILAHWHILSRLMYRAEIFSGVAQTIVDILGTGSIQGVRESVAEVISYAATLKAFVIAAEEQSEIKHDVMIPSEELITAGRLHSITHYPKVMHILRDLCGQGLVSRFTSKAWKHPEVGPVFDDILKGTGVSAYEKNKFFNFVWDMTCGSHAARVALFENVNSTNAPVVRMNLYSSYNREHPVNFIREYLDLPKKE